ncbi:astacin [Ancylostoma ceylanicum]|uniref:Metalloendopeptidase n=1 Tax=Ancylostoma ceylanicum TaxID=53326 RepID=A0A0D6LW88_9BILA|nr:astacin [Ancylostoma ceylanicum]
MEPSRLVHRMLICLGVFASVTITYAILPSKFELNDFETLLNASTVEMFLNGGAGPNNGNWYNAIRNRHQLWPNGRIPYTISSQYSSYSRSLIAASMQEYSTHTCIQWVPKTNNDINYVYIFPDRGCYSMVGKIGGKQSLSLGSGCIQKGIIIHELMHAVGFFHEQSRTDRDDYITILWNNIQPGMQGQFEKYGQGTIQSLGTTYDYSSIMHYGGKVLQDVAEFHEDVLCKELWILLQTTASRSEHNTAANTCNESTANYHVEDINEPTCANHQHSITRSNATNSTSVQGSQTLLRTLEDGWIL